MNHAGDFTSQLQSGYRVFDLRIACLPPNDQNFYWWHGLTGDNVRKGIKSLKLDLQLGKEIICMK